MHNQNGSLTRLSTLRPGRLALALALGLLLIAASATPPPAATAVQQ